MSLNKFYIVLIIIGIIIAISARAQEDGSEQSATPPPPCESDEAFSAFDFWLGDWAVHTADGRYAGKNSIRKVLKGCLITESWQGAQGSEGSSINYFDRSADEWVQVWNDAGGGQIHIRGGLDGDSMRLVGKIHYISNGKTADFRGLWTPLSDGRVRQFFEQSLDGGDTWSVWFEGYYSPLTSD